MKFTFSFLFTFFIAISGYSQQLDNYEYIIVPEQFQFLDEPNKYSLNTATMQQLNSYGFKAFLGNKDLPFSIKDHICDILNLKVEDVSGLLRTKIKFVLEDCEGNIVYVSNEGSSRQKEYRKAYPEAFREALQSFKGLSIKKEESKEQSENIEVVSKNKIEVKKGIVEKEPKKKSNTTRKIVSSKPTLASDELVYTSTDGFYKMIQKGNTLTFYENQKNIGASNAVANTQFAIETSEFKGVGYFDNGILIVERVVKGVGKVQMKFLK